jgi:hypothetical protein
MPCLYRQRERSGIAPVYCAGGWVNLGVNLEGMGNFVLPEFNPWPIRPIDSHYTDHTIPAAVTYAY